MINLFDEKEEISKKTDHKMHLRRFAYSNAFTTVMVNIPETIAVEDLFKNSASSSLAAVKSVLCSLEEGIFSLYMQEHDEYSDLTPSDGTCGWHAISYIEDSSVEKCRFDLKNKDAYSQWLQSKCAVNNFNFYHIILLNIRIDAKQEQSSRNCISENESVDYMAR